MRGPQSHLSRDPPAHRAGPVGPGNHGAALLLWRLPPAPADGVADRKGRAVAWDFSTEPEFQDQLDWMDEFVTDEVEPLDLLWGGEGQAFAIAQTRLGGGRVHHAMRTVGNARKALDMLCERAVSRKTRDGVLADKQSVRDFVADSYVELLQFRLLVMYVAWCIDQGADHRSIRRDIAAITVLTPKVLHDVTQRAIQVHGALGVSDEMPLGGLWMTAPIMGLVDGPTEVHRNTVARQVLKGYEPVEGLWPSQHLPARVARARAKYADHPEALASASGGEEAGLAEALEHEVGNL